MSSGISLVAASVMAASASSVELLTESVSQDGQVRYACWAERDSAAVASTPGPESIMKASQGAGFLLAAVINLDGCNFGRCCGGAALRPLSLLQ